MQSKATISDRSNPPSMCCIRLGYSALIFTIETADSDVRSTQKPPPGCSIVRARGWSLVGLFGGAVGRCSSCFQRIQRQGADSSDVYFFFLFLHKFGCVSRLRYIPVPTATHSQTPFRASAISAETSPIRCIAPEPLVHKVGKEEAAAR